MVRDVLWIDADDTHAASPIPGRDLWADPTHANHQRILPVGLNERARPYPASSRRAAKSCG